jgi:hypothetical protein
MPFTLIKHEDLEPGKRERGSAPSRERRSAPSGSFDNRIYIGEYWICYWLKRVVVGVIFEVQCCTFIPITQLQTDQ